MDIFDLSLNNFILWVESAVESYDDMKQAEAHGAAR